MPAFGIYYFQFKHDNGSIKKYNSTVIGQVCLQSKRYIDMQIQDACLFRMKEQLSLQKNIPIDPLSQIVNYGFYWIETQIKQRGVDNLIRDIIEYTYHIKSLTMNNGASTEVINLQDKNCQQVLDFAISKLVGYNIKYGGKNR